MKYMITCSVVLLACLAAGYGISRLLRAKTTRPNKGGMTLFLTLVLGIVLMSIVALAYFSVYSHAGEKAATALKGTDGVAVQEVDGGYFFDGPGIKKAIVFYPGAKVEASAYAPLMVQLAARGLDCFLADMPFNFVIFGMNAADMFMGAYEYDSWILAGHSMGGMMAASHADGCAGDIDGLVLLASYATSPIDDSVKACSIYGDQDGCLDMSEYEKCESNWPVDTQETVIAGGNHAQFADYGAQDGDNQATISAEDQQAQTAAAIAACFLYE